MSFLPPPPLNRAKVSAYGQRDISGDERVGGGNVLGKAEGRLEARGIWGSGWTLRRIWAGTRSQAGVWVLRGYHEGDISRRDNH